MKDFMGQEVVVGDKVAFCLGVAGSLLFHGTIKNLTPKGVTITYMDGVEISLSRMSDQFVKLGV